jgi:tetratricopeptide (TPR) repeat protein
VVKLANSLIQVGRVSDAQRYLTTALGRDEAADEVRQLLARLYREQCDYDALAPLLAEGVAHASSVADRVAYLRETASVHWRKLDRVQDSIKYYRQAVELDPSDQSLQLALADALGDNAEYAEAQQILESLLEGFGRRRTKERAHVHYHLAKIAKATGDLDRALKELDAASSIERSDPSILHLLGEVARSKGQLERAEKAYRTLLLILGRKLNEPGASLPPAMGPSAILFELSQIASEMDQPERSKDLLDSALEAASEDPEEARRLEEALRESDSPEVLLKVIELRLANASATEPKAETLYAKADVLLKLGRGRSGRGATGCVCGSPGRSDAARRRTSAGRRARPNGSLRRRDSALGRFGFGVTRIEVRSLALPQPDRWRAR